MSRSRTSQLAHQASQVDQPRSRRLVALVSTDKCPIHPDGNHKWGDCYQNILNKDKKGAKKSKSLPAHEANLMDIDPPDDAPINDIELSGDECIIMECHLSFSGEECEQDGE
jgi:hypothetical protein